MNTGAVLGRLNSLPSPRGVALRIMQLARSEDATVTEIARVAQAEEGTARRFGGTGLGLAICREIVRRMDGEIGVDSASGEGSRFWFTARLPAASGAAVGDDLLPRADAPRWPGRRVLLAEDDPVNAEVASAMLRECGIEAIVAADGAQTVAAAAARRFDLILMDCQMPAMDGFEATRRIRAGERERRTPIVALTAHAVAGYRQQCLAAGMDDFVPKPFKIAVLHAMLARWLGAGVPAAGASAAPPAQSGAHEVLDPAQLGTLHALDPDGREGLVPRVVALYLESAPKYVASIGAWRSGDPHEVARAAHSLKSSSHLLGATRVAEIAKRIEAALRTGEDVDLQALASELARAWTLARLALRALSAGRTPA